MKWEFGGAVLGGLLGGALIVWGAGKSWQSGPVVTPGVITDAGSTLAGSLGAVVLAGAVVVAVTRDWGRRVAGGLTAIAGLAAVYAVFEAGGGWPVWRMLVLVGAVLAIAAGTLAATRGPRWASMSRRYDAPGAQANTHETDPWRAMDRGDDPTL